MSYCVVKGASDNVNVILGSRGASDKVNIVLRDRQIVVMSYCVPEERMRRRTLYTVLEGATDEQSFGDVLREKIHHTRRIQA